MEKAYTMAEEPYTRIYARIDLDAIVKNMEAMRENLPAKAFSEDCRNKKMWTRLHFQNI